MKGYEPTVGGKTYGEWQEILRPLLKDETERYLDRWFGSEHGEQTYHELESKLTDIRLLHVEDFTFTVLDPSGRLPVALRAWASQPQSEQTKYPIIAYLRRDGFQVEEPVNIYADDPGTWEVYR